MAKPQDSKAPPAVLAEIAESARMLVQLGHLLDTLSDLDKGDRQAVTYAVRVIAQRAGWLADTMAGQMGLVNSDGFTAEDWLFPPLAKRGEVGHG